MSTLRWTAVLGLALALLPGPAVADPADDARRAFLARRDADALQREIDRGALRPSADQRAWVRWAAGGEVDLAGTSAAVRAVDALRRGRLSRARRLVADAERRAPGPVATWLGALVRARSGDDAGAQGRLMAPPLFLYGTDAFDLALLSAALPVADRYVLRAVGAQALRRAAGRARIPAVFSIALALAALDPVAGADEVAVALRALRRAGAAQEVAALLVAAEAAHVDLRHPRVAAEAARAAWLTDRSALPKALARLDPATPLAQALARAGRPRAAKPRAPLHHRTGDDAENVAAARLLTALGRPTDEADVRAWRLGHAREFTRATFVRRLLVAWGMRAVACAGDPTLARKVLERGYPILMQRIVRAGKDYAERAVLVHTLDRATGLLVLDEPHVDRVDVVDAAWLSRTRCVVAVPAAEAALLTGAEETPGGRRGRVLELELAAQETGRIVSRNGSLQRDAPVSALYRSYVAYRKAVARGAGDALPGLRPSLEHALASPPMPAFAHYALAQAHFAEGKLPAALAALDDAAALERTSAPLALARFAIHRSARETAAANAALDTALRLEPLDARALYLRGSLRVRAGQVAAARTDLRRALDRSPRSEPIAVALAELEVDAENPAAAVAVIRELTRYAPRHQDTPRVRAIRQGAELALLAEARTMEQLRPFRRSVDADVRRALAFRLAGLEGEEAEPLLRSLLADDEEGVRVTVLRLYMRPGLRARVEKDGVLLRAILQVLREDPAANVRIAAAQLLGRVKASNARRALADLLVGAARDRVPEVRRAAAQALSGHAKRESHIALVGGLADESKPVRAAAIDSLFRLTGWRGAYDAAAPADARQKAIDGWKAWLEGEGKR